MKETNLDSLDIRKEIYDIPYTDLKGYKYTDKHSNNVVTIEKDSNYGTNFFVMLVNGGLAKNLFGNVLYWETLNDAEKDICNLFCGNNPEHYSAFRPCAERELPKNQVRHGIHYAASNQMDRLGADQRFGGGY